MPGGTALFGNAASRSSNKNLVEFKAGKMTMKGKMLHPDKRKGLVYIYQSEDSLMHFCWKDRNSGSVEDDLIIFPDDVEFKKVQCPTGRVYILKFKSSSRKFFFWLQEPKVDKDEDNCRKVNEVLNNPPSLGSQRSGGATPDGDLQNLLSNMSQQQLMQLFGGVGQIGGLSSLLGTMSQNSSRSSGNSNTSSTTSASAVAATVTTSTPSAATATTTTTTAAAAATPAPASAVTSTPTPTPAATPQQQTTTSTAPKAAAPTTPTNSGITTATPQAPVKPTTSASNPAQLRQLLTYLSDNLAAAGAGGTVQSPSTPTSRSAELPTNLPANLTADGLQAEFNNPEFVKEVLRLLPPSNTEGKDLIRSTQASPPFQLALSMLRIALQSGQLNSLISQFDVGPETINAANQGNMEEVVWALVGAPMSGQQQQQQQSESQDSMVVDTAPSAENSSTESQATTASINPTTPATSDPPTLANKEKPKEEEDMNLD